MSKTIIFEAKQGLYTWKVEAVCKHEHPSAFMFTLVAPTYEQALCRACTLLGKFGFCFNSITLTRLNRV